MSLPQRNQSFNRSTSKKLDAWFRGPRNASTSVSRSTGAHIPRPQSEYDFTDEDNETMIYQLDDGELNIRFEEMLNDMNLTDKKKEPLRRLPIKKKREMLVMHSKGTEFCGKGSNQENRSKLDKPIDYIKYLQQPDLSLNKTYNCIESLRIALTENTLSWVHEFSSPGLKLLFSTIERCCKGDEKYDRLQHECLRCLKTFMNNTVGLKQVLETEQIIILAQCLIPDRPNVMSEALKILSVLCLIEDDEGRFFGHEKVLNIIIIIGEKRNHERFTPIIDGLKTKNKVLWGACLQFINAVINVADDFDYRMHLRNEIVRCGLFDHMDDLRNSKIEQVEVQIYVFDQNRQEDCDLLLQRFDNVRMEMDNLNDCFEVLKTTTLDTPAEPYFLSILQHLLFIRNDPLIKRAYYKLIEECITQIVLHKNGLDPDFRANRRFQIDMQPLIDWLKETSRADEEKKNDDLKKKLSEVIAQNQELAAKLALME